MIKILRIFVFVLVYYCEINAEIDRFRYMKGITNEVRKNFLEKTFSGNHSFEAQPRAKFTTRSPLTKFSINTDESLNNDLGPHVDKTLRAKNRKNGDMKKAQTEKNDTVTNQPKKKKEPTHNSAKLQSNNTGKIDTKHEKDKKINKEKGRKGKIIKHKTHTEKDNKYTEKSIHRDKHTNITEESKNDHINKTKKTKDIPKHKYSEKKKQAVVNSKDDIKIAKVGVTVLRANAQSQSSNKKTKKSTSTMKQWSKPGNAQSQSSNKETKKSTSTMKQLSKPGKVGVVYKKMHDRKVPLPLHKDGNIRGNSSQGSPGGTTSFRALEHDKGGDHKEEGVGHGGDGHGEGGHGGGGHGGGHGEGGHGGGGHGGGGHGGGHGGGGHGGGGKHDEKHSYPSYLSPYGLMAQMEELMKEFPEANATVTKLARTVEYNDIVLISVSEHKTNQRFYRARESKYIEDAPEKKIIFIVHGLTVMGMKSMSSLTNISDLKLLFSYYFKHLDKFDFFIMPLANPDGYSASRAGEDTIWNKNMSPQSVCPGVFVDRNFDIAWNVTRDISSCSQIYPGPIPFSEVESKAVRDVFHYYSHKILAYIHVHCGTFDERVFKGDAILYPRGYTESQTDDDKYIDLKGEIDEAMKNASFRVISVTMDTLASWYGIVSGTSVDYAAAIFGIPYALEFVMQIYDKDTINNNALTQIWSRLIDTTLTNMWKSVHHASEEKRAH